MGCPPLYLSALLLFAVASLLLSGVAGDAFDFFDQNPTSTSRTKDSTTPPSPFWMPPTIASRANIPSPRWFDADTALSVPNGRGETKRDSAVTATPNHRSQQPIAVSTNVFNDDDPASPFSRGATSNRFNIPEVYSKHGVLSSLCAMVEAVLQSVKQGGIAIYELQIFAIVRSCATVAVDYLSTPVDFYVGLLPDRAAASVATALVHLHTYHLAIFITFQCVAHLLLALTCIWIFLAVKGAWKQHTILSCCTVLLSCVLCITYALSALIATQNGADSR